MESVLLRERFDTNSNCSREKACELLLAGQNELNRIRTYSKLEFANSYHGLTHDRSSTYMDYLLDYWHPLEKAQYPEYFSRREERKAEFIKMWNDYYYPSTKGKDTTDKILPPKPTCK